MCCADGAFVSDRTETFQHEATEQLQAARACGELPAPEALLARIDDAD